MDDYLLIRFLANDCSPEELQQIDRWIASNEANSQWLFEMEQTWMLKDRLCFSEQQKIKQAYNRFASRKVNAVTPRSNIRPLLAWSKYAAAVIVIVLLSLNLYKIGQNEADTAMNVIEVPKGERVNITLSDGTQIWLNAESKLTYPSRFASKNREIRMEGEAYFKVAKNKQKPFIIKNSLFDLQVTGTEFNVQAYSGENAEISLKTGEVIVNATNSCEKITMKPNDQVLYTTDGKTIRKQSDMSAIDSWTRDAIFLMEKPLSDIVKTLERKYNVSILLTDQSLSKVRFTCRTKPGTSIAEVLNLLKETRQINYEFNNNSLIIIKKMPMEQ
ncbi:MAG: FecR domain-containing protein [Dysgonamonadaceae bacterium]|jgi:ferric-dicitrate binding protein FerR (iron transport regulator)|nr:FecR domain-containing protein [Dysgonamonadaceae bacterium]